MTGNAIPYEHTDRLRAILTTYFSFLYEAGFDVAESTYDAPRLVGRALLRRPDVVIEANLHNDDLDLFVAPAVPNPVFVKVNLVVLYLKRARVDYAEFMRRQSSQPTEPDQEEIWSATAADVAGHLEEILAFAEADGYENRLADRVRYEAEVAADVEKQIAEFSGELRD